MAATKQAQREKDGTQDENVTAQEVIDFKMVTFSLGGKDYGIDIMRIKEIAKFAQFTYVPNTAPYVRGVYNLRGDIISIIDLRLMFNLPAEPKSEGEAENGLILRLENNHLGVIVDSIDKVVGFNSRHIQPPHPIFGDINIKFISGVAEHDGRLYIILDVDRIFRKEEDPDSRTEEKLVPRASARRESEPPVEKPVARAEAAGTSRSESRINQEFLREGLATFSSFHVSPVNEAWFLDRITRWEEERRSADKSIQLTNREETEEFLTTFYSRYTGRFWQNDLTDALKGHLPDIDHSMFHLWNPGCSGGHESYSLAVTLKRRYADKQIKIWAGDTDLMKISTAPNLVFGKNDVPESWNEFLTENKNGYTFQSVLKDLILFEFSDVVNGTALPKMDMIVCRDLVSFLSTADQNKCFSVFEEVLKPSGLLMLGENEKVPNPDAWELLEAPLSLYRRK